MGSVVSLFFLSLFICVSSASDNIKFLSDPDKRVAPDFQIVPEFKEQVEFWFQIYTVYNSDQFILYDRQRPQLILDVISLSDHPNKSPAIIQKAIMGDYMSALDSLANGERNCDLCSNILKLYASELPKNKAVHRSFFTNLKSRLRFQTGQKNFIQRGLFYYSSFETKINQLITLFEIPKELIAIAFLESSFNTEARSRLNATGVWQFMKATGQDFMLIESKQDHRLNPLISTLAAFQFLKQMHKSLGRWDLAIWSYNSGAQHIRNALKTFERPDMTLAQFFKYYQHPNIGFASQSFYPSFLALAHALAYKSELYEPVTSKYLDLNTEALHFYVTLCSLQPEWFYNQLSSSPDTRSINRHLLQRYNQTSYPRGTILVSDRDLTSRRYYKVAPEFYTSRYPKNWRLLIRNLKCQTN